MKQDPYRWDNTQGWRSYRALRPGRGMYHDIKRRLPYYWSDITDAINYRTVAATVRIYFVNILPALAYMLDMYRRTGEFYGVNEALFSSALAAMVFSILGAQPLTVVGITGLISLFNYTIYDIIAMYDISIYPQFMVWVGIWAAILHWIAAFLNTSDYMRFVTDFSSTAFGMYVGIIYIIKGIEELVDEFTRGSIDGYLSCVVAILYVASVYGLEKIGSGVVFDVRFRTLLADYSYPIATIFWVGFVHIPGRLKDANITKLPITRAFYPTQPRPNVWLVDFWNIDIRWVFIAIPFGLLITLLFYYDHNVSSLTAQAKQFPLKKPGGFHWDFFLLGCTTFISAIIGLPFPNGLVPQAPVHTDACTNYETTLKLITTDEKDEGEPIEIRKPVVFPESVLEQRVTHFIMGLGLIGTMTGPLLVVLGTMPRALFAGVFLVVGWGSIEGNAITHKIVFLMRESRFIDPQEPLRHIRKRAIVHFLFWQLLGVLSSVAISQTIAAIGFPVIITALIPLRWVILPKLFTRKELEIMDDLTANSDVVLASLGGKPRMKWEKRDPDGDNRSNTATVPGSARPDKDESAVANDNEDADTHPDEPATRTASNSEKNYLEKRQGVKRQRAGSYSRG